MGGRVSHMEEAYKILTWKPGGEEITWKTEL
jgi:hypothetical protein